MLTAWQIFTISCGNKKKIQPADNKKIFPELTGLTGDHLGHAAGGVDAADVFGMGGVGVVAKEEGCGAETTFSM